MPRHSIVCFFRDIGFRYVPEISSFRGESHFDDALKLAEKAVKNSETHNFRYQKTLCEYCRHSANGNISICPWVARFEPVPGWDAIQTTLYSNYRMRGSLKKREIKSYCVLACPLYQPDPPRKKVL